VRLLLCKFPAFVDCSFCVRVQIRFNSS
jgi:hypothetical protein